MELSKNKKVITISKEYYDLYANSIATVNVCSHLKGNDLLSKYIKGKIFEELINPYNIIKDPGFTQEPIMN